MAKINVVGNAVVLTSTMKLEDIKTVAKYAPEALTLKDENKEPYFAVGVSDCRNGNIGEFGVEFGCANADGFATVTMLSCFTGDNVSEEIADLIGRPLLNIAKVEQILGDVLDSVKAERDAIMANITVE